MGDGYCACRSTVHASPGSRRARPWRLVEPRLAAELFARWPDRVAEVLAHEVRRATLRADAGKPVGARDNPPKAWLDVLPLDAELQRGEAEQAASPTCGSLRRRRAATSSRSEPCRTPTRSSGCAALKATNRRVSRCTSGDRTRSPPGIRGAPVSAGHRSSTTSSLGCEQQMSGLPSAGGSTGCGLYSRSPAISVVSQLRQTPVRQDQRTGTSPWGRVKELWCHDGVILSVAQVDEPPLGGTKRHPDPEPRARLRRTLRGLVLASALVAESRRAGGIRQHCHKGRRAAVWGDWSQTPSMRL
jgi:hypothetical protein